MKLRNFSAATQKEKATTLEFSDAVAGESVAAKLKGLQIRSNYLIFFCFLLNFADLKNLP